MARGLYKITNTRNGKFYIGSSIDTRKRFKQHKRSLKGKTHHNKHLQYSWNKYGADAFVFHVIEIIPKWESLETAEDIWLTRHVGKEHCYNVGTSAKAPMRGATHSDKVKAKISTKVQEVLADGKGGHFVPSKETRKRMSDSLQGNQCAKGVKRSDEEKEAIKKRMLGNTIWKGKHHTNETREKLGKKLIEVTTGKEFAVMNDAVKFYKMANLVTILRSIETGQPISKGPNSGLLFAYESEPLPAVVKHEDYPTTRAEATRTGATHYFTGKPCGRGHVAIRVVKGACTDCQKEDWAKDNAKKKGSVKSEAAKEAGRRYYQKNKETVKARALNRSKEDKRRYNRTHKQKLRNLQTSP